MRSKARPPTPEQSERIRKVKAIGCLACRQLTPPRYTYAAADHHVKGSRRLGHDKTSGLCDWHHQAYPPDGYTHKRARAELGPSKAEGTKPFVARFGTDEERLTLQNQLLENFHEMEV